MGMDLSLSSAFKIPAALSPEIKTKLHGLISILQQDFTPRWEKISKTFLVEEIEDFSREIMELGNQYRLKILEEWGQHLLEDTRNYDLQKITRTLKYYPALIKGIMTLTGKIQQQE